MDAVLRFKKNWIDACSETSFGDGSCRIETSGVICSANPLTGFCVLLVLAEICFRTDIKELLCFFITVDKNHTEGALRAQSDECNETFCEIS